MNPVQFSQMGFQYAGESKGPCMSSGMSPLCRIVLETEMRKIAGFVI